MSDQKFTGRREDVRLVTGHGRYTADVTMDRQAAAYFLRSDRAHARIRGIDTAKARSAPGVIDIVTGADMAAAGWKGLPAMAFFKGVGGSSLNVPPRFGLAHERVRFVGEPVAVIVAETEHMAADAAELIEVDYEDLPVLVEAADASAAGAVRIHDEVPGNLAFEYEYGNREAADRAMAGAAHVVRVKVRAQRIAGNPMEPKSAVASYDAASDAFELAAPTQGISDIKNTLASITGLPVEALSRPLRRCRRRLRHQERSLSGISGAAAGGKAQRTRRQMDRHARRNAVRRSSRARRRSLRRTRPR